ncbi:flagellar protein FliT [Guyparkeria sp. SCN-R1]|uniref:flagellar protein FliT n=1 Tax=Guyparkeria sp. SCN-R1 TaxID=2341113 RepID=UPI000F649484|nr:flagellar protein FliT [Guyparkeria sp. SCN-R1]RRQ24204.1 flagellar protein FliT [Guyparkeria sp. SCN-R1]
MTHANLPDRLPVGAQNLLAISQGMLASAKADDWEAVIEAEEIRRPMIDEVVAQGAPNDAAPAEWMRELLEELQTLNDRVVALGEERKAEIRSDLSEVQTGSKAVKAYDPER